MFFLESLIALTRKLELKYQSYSKLKIELNHRQQQVLEFIRKNKMARVGEIESKLGDYSRNTLKKDLSYLVKEGLILMIGSGRGTRYHWKE